jgi:hypothetical protein
VGGVLTVPSEAKKTMDFVFNNGNGKWDNHAANDWHISLSVNDPAVVNVSPENPAVGEKVTITYNAVNRSLSGASNVNIYWGVDNWSNTSIQTTKMQAKGNDKWEIVLTVPGGAQNTLDFVFNDGNGNWDNHAANDWHITVS